MTKMLNTQGYLLMGEDNWLKAKWFKTFKQDYCIDEQDMMNYVEIKAKDLSFSKLEDTLNTLPFFASHKLIYLKDSGLFKAGKKEESDSFLGLIKDLPEYILLVVDEKEVDKRNKLYKVFKERYAIIVCDYPGEEQVITILQKELKKNRLEMDKGNLLYFIRNMPENVEAILTEFQKLITYVEEGKITQEAIDAVCIFSLEKRVFELVKKIGAKESSEALAIYNRMIQSKESPIGILVLIARHYRVMLQIKYLSSKRNLSQKELATQLKLPYFAVKELTEQSRKYSFKQLEAILAACLETDQAIKTGKMEGVKCVEVLIMNCLNQPKIG
ncbi:DNA polymerase III subunit delta [Sporanaerobium hydrogeniformans]|uniref:DNA polymerase III subunit delta n=1 Tax=Sporanaerobium hydrogeniformans TaxID=3072179 RepID=A0AC61DED2_9FIRM|nr:DNA polymerase III subunit delta [Sporanaerobium hydrogeniformans]PHV71505.1 DNA polymerase III subunit delta [Sporanaerobium hydrogeniformans]